MNEVSFYKALDSVVLEYESRQFDEIVNAFHEVRQTFSKEANSLSDHLVVDREIAARTLYFSIKKNCSAQLIDQLFADYDRFPVSSPVASWLVKSQYLAHLESVGRFDVSAEVLRKIKETHHDLLDETREVLEQVSSWGKPTNESKGSDLFDESDEE